MAIAPGFFPAFLRQHPEIAGFQVLPRAGRAHNELTRFRYDAVLQVSDGAPLATEPAKEPQWLDWQAGKFDLAGLRRLLSETRPESLALRHIPNARLSQEVAAMTWLREAGPQETMSRMRSQLAAQVRPGIEPDDLQALEALGYRVELSWLGTDASGAFDAVFSLADRPAASVLFPSAGSGLRRLSEYCSHPRRAKLDRLLIPELRQFLKERLPHYMMPAVFTVLDKFPLSPNNKIDRKALEQFPVTIETGPDDDAPAARTPLERLLLDAWAEALDLSRVGLDDNFFELGGNSLHAVALTHGLQRKLGRSIRPVALLQAPTPSRFAAYLESNSPEPLAATVSVIGGAMEEGEI
jgi:acyl carrier protein